MLPSNPKFPFQQTVINFFDLHGRNYVIYSDCYTCWIEVTLTKTGKVRAVCHTLRTWFCTYGAPEELSSNGGPLFDFLEYNVCLKNWEIWKYISSVYCLQSNDQAKLAIKTAKFILTDNTDSCRRLCHDCAVCALLAHCNTSVQDLDISPAKILYSCVIKYHLPILWHKY